MATTRPLTELQKKTLDWLREHGEWSIYAGWHNGMGNNHTARTLRLLANKGFCTEVEPGRWKPT